MPAWQFLRLQGESPWRSGGTAPLDPGSVTPKLNNQWQPVYRVTFPDGSTDVLGQEDIWHVRILTLDGLVGLNPIAYAREAISLGLATEEHGARLFGNGAVTSGVLRTEQQLSDIAYNRLKADFEAKHQGWPMPISR
ncbi:phage portal protein [Mangrovibacter sp. SLW1]